MNYCILNGKKSTLIKGLLIQSLPPISKPLMRTSKETIDGRDGDIIRKMGYSAYDKQMKIGLFGDFDIDEVISFFDSEGIVIFSNEPDKFYKYTIINQIDFERLLRFRTATVTFHCQPFKYSSVDNSYLFDINQIRYKGFRQIINGVTVTANNGKIFVEGTPTVLTEFYIPINDIKTKTQEYHLVGSLLSGFYPYTDDTIKVRLIKDVPDDAHSFAGTYLSLKDNSSVEIFDFAMGEEYNYIWIQILPSNRYDVVIDLTFNDATVKNFSILNNGNIESKPIFTLYGENNIKLSFTNLTTMISKSLDIALGNEGYITIDIDQMNAYKGDTLKNRLVTGDYSKMVLSVGLNRISWTGTVTKMIIENASRWI